MFLTFSPTSQFTIRMKNSQFQLLFYCYHSVYQYITTVIGTSMIKNNNTKKKNFELLRISLLEL